MDLPSANSYSHYTFLHHRPLTGLEELLCIGLTASRARLQLKYFNDTERRHLAPPVTPPAVIGTLFGAVLVVVNLPKHEDVIIPKDRLSILEALDPN